MLEFKDIEPGKYYFIQGEDTRNNDKFCYCYKVISRNKDNIKVYEIFDRFGNIFKEGENRTSYNITPSDDDKYYQYEITELQNPWEEIPEYFI